jgi:hypothetical protein
LGPKEAFLFNFHRHELLPVIRKLRLPNCCQHEFLSITDKAVTNPQALPNHLFEAREWYFVTHLHFCVHLSGWDKAMFAPKPGIRASD